MNTLMKLTAPEYTETQNLQAVTPAPKPQYVEDPEHKAFSAFGSVPLKFPVSLLPYLLYSIESQIRSIFRNYELTTEHPTKVNLYLYCEHNYNLHLIEADCKAGESALTELFEKIERQLFKLDLSNPICSMDIEVMQEAAIKSKVSRWQNKKLDDKANQSNSTPLNASSIETGSYDWLQEAFMELEDEFEVPLEKHQLDKYTFISKTPVAQGTVEKQTPNAHLRGRQRYIAIDSKRQLVCLTYDEIENRHYFNGFLNK